MLKTSSFLFVAVFFFGTACMSSKKSSAKEPEKNLPAQVLIPYSKNGLWGYCTPDKKIVVPAKYKEAG